MRLTGKKIKSFFNAPEGILIFKKNKMVFINCKTCDVNTVETSEEDDDDKKIIQSSLFSIVNVLDDNKEYYIDVVFEIIEFIDAESEQIQLAISGIRY